MLLAGNDAVERLIAQVEATRHSGAVGGIGGGVVATGSASTPEPAVPGVPLLAGPGGLARVLDGLPQRPDNKGRTTGQLFRESGRPVHGGRLLSFRDPRLLDDLSLSGRARQSDSMDSHVEAKAAKMIRDGDAPQHSTLVINNADGPCGWLARQQGEPRYGTTCDELLSDALPSASSLTVRWRDHGGVERSQIYRGTGRSIKR
jgi:hypothetical protein